MAKPFHDITFDCNVSQWAVSVSKSRDTCVCRLDSHGTRLRTAVFQFVKPLGTCEICHVRFNSFFTLRTVEVTISDRPRQFPHATCIQSTRPKAAQGSAKTDYGGADGWQPKSPLTASGRGNQPAEGLPESNRGCPGPVTSRDTAAGSWSRTESSHCRSNQWQSRAVVAD